MGLDIGVGGRGFISDFDRENQIADNIAYRCRTCGRDKRMPKGTIKHDTDIKDHCQECGRPRVWISTNNYNGKRELHEIVRLPSGHFKEVISPDRTEKKGFRIIPD